MRAKYIYKDYPVETETETNTDETEAETETDTTTTTDITVSGAFRVPADNGYGLCNNYNSPKFLQNSESTCTQKVIYIYIYIYSYQVRIARIPSSTMRNSRAR